MRKFKQEEIEELHKGIRFDMKKKRKGRFQSEVTNSDVKKMLHSKSFIARNILK